jgi:hypothetical protein
MHGVSIAKLPLEGKHYDQRDSLVANTADNMLGIRISMKMWSMKALCAPLESLSR